VPAKQGLTHEHRGYTINRNPNALRKYQEEGGEALVNEKMRYFLEKSGSNLQFMSEPAQQASSDPSPGFWKDYIKIFPLIYSSGEIDEDKVMLKCHFITPEGTSLHDDRGIHNEFTLRIRSKGKIMDALRSGRVEHFIMALRNAGVIINPDTAVMLDAPMGLPGKNEPWDKSLYVADFPNKTIIASRAEPIQKTNYANDDEFLQGCVGRGIASNYSKYNKPQLEHTFIWGGDLRNYSPVEEYRALNPDVDKLTFPH
jgi:hypothetical protein